MSLIEQLGGYEKAKAFLNATSFTIDELIMMQRSGLRTQHVEKALLEYRRQHNIFEVGDIIKRDKSTLLMRVTKVTDKKVYVDILNHKTMDFIHRDEFLKTKVSHADDAEIEAGHRL